MLYKYIYPSVCRGIYLYYISFSVRYQCKESIINCDIFKISFPLCRLCWKSYNIVGEEGISKVTFLRDFCNMASESDMEDHIFQKEYASFIIQWKEKYGWSFYLPLSEADQYNLTQIQIPLVNSQSEFDQLILSLVKVLIDSLNEKELIVTGEDNTGLKGISKLEKWLQSKEVAGYEEHISFLRDLQKLRSTGTGHRKGKEYSKISNSFGLSEKSKIDAFEAILQKANASLKYLSITFLDKKRM